MFDTVDCRTHTDDVGTDKPSDGNRATCVLDLAHLRSFTLGMADLEREILGLFQEQLPKSQSALEASQSARDWYMAAHTLKGSALAVGARRLAAAAAQAETTDCCSADARLAVLMRVAEAITEVESEIVRLGMT